MNGITDELYECLRDTEVEVEMDMGEAGMQTVRFFHSHADKVDWVFIDHLCFHRPGGPYGDSYGDYKDNVFRS